MRAYPSVTTPPGLYVLTSAPGAGARRWLIQRGGQSRCPPLPSSLGPWGETERRDGVRETHGGEGAGSRLADGRTLGVTHSSEGPQIPNTGS